jgi:hypothetical protein
VEGVGYVADLDHHRHVVNVCPCAAHVNPRLRSRGHTPDNSVAACALPL